LLTTDRAPAKTAASVTTEVRPARSTTGVVIADATARVTGLSARLPVSTTR